MTPWASVGVVAKKVNGCLLHSAQVCLCLDNIYRGSMCCAHTLQNEKVQLWLVSYLEICKVFTISAENLLKIFEIWFWCLLTYGWLNQVNTLGWWLIIISPRQTENYNLQTVFSAILSFFSTGSNCFASFLLIYFLLEESCRLDGCAMWFNFFKGACSHPFIGEEPVFNLYSTKINGKLRDIIKHSFWLWI